MNEIYTPTATIKRDKNKLANYGANRFSTRIASEKDFAAIWNLYLQTNFLYAEKLATMPDGGRQAQDNLRKLLSLNSEFFQILLCENQAAELLAVCTHAQSSAAQSHVMHLASNGNIKALLKNFQASQQISAVCPADFISYTFRPNNPGVRRLFVSVLKDVTVDFENEIYDYYKFSTADFKAFKSKSDDFQIQSATENDRLFLLENCADAAQKVILKSLGKFDDSAVSNVAKVFNSAELLRSRKVISIKKGNILQGVAVIEISPDWWNFSGLGTGIRLFMLNEDEQIACRLLASATEILVDFPTACWTMLVSSRQPAVSNVLQKLGFQSPKKYQRISVPQFVSVSILQNYCHFIERKKEVY